MTASTTPFDRVQSAPEKSVSIPPPPIRSERRTVPPGDARTWTDPVPGARSRRLADAALVAAGLLTLVVNALVLRTVVADRPSAYMDEATFILTGRYLIERGAVYADALDWTYGSYLWSLVAASADLAGGLALVRLVVAALGVLMALATAVAAARLAPAGPDRWIAGLLAGALMAALPPAIGVGRFGTYDSLAGAAFMSGVALILPGRAGHRWFELLGGAVLLFVGFLAKYVVAVFFPFICLYFLISPLLPPWSPRALIHRLTWFVVPLSAACAVYFWVFQEDLITLLAFSSTYSDLTSPFPLREYVYHRPELWLLATLAAIGALRATRRGRWVALGGVLIVAAFQALTRADVDFWKHTIYLFFFLAPLAGLALAPAVRLGLAWRSGEPPTPWSRRRAVALLVAAGLIAPAMVLVTYPDRLVAAVPALGPALQALAAVIAQTRLFATDFYTTLAITVLVILGMLLAPVVELLLEQRAKAGATPLPGRAGRRLADVGRGAGLVGSTLVAGILLAAALTAVLDQSSRILRFYPDLTDSIAAIQAHTADARTVLVDDSAVRYYLYPRISTDRVTDPFAITYRGQSGIDAYRLAIADRYYDAIVLDGGVGPIGRRIRQELGGDVAHHYQRVHEMKAPNGALVEIYRPRESTADGGPAEGALVFDFDDGLQGWGGHPDVGELQPGLNVEIVPEPSWNGNATLAFSPTDTVSMLGVKKTGQVSRVRAQIYIVPDDRVAAEIRVAMMGFDERWEWQDDLFQHVLPVGRWAEITWDLQQPGIFHELGFKFQPGTVRTAYLAQVEVLP